MLTPDNVATIFNRIETVSRGSADTSRGSIEDSKRLLFEYPMHERLLVIGYAFAKYAITPFWSMMLRLTLDAGSAGLETKSALEPTRARPQRLSDPIPFTPIIDRGPCAACGEPEREHPVHTDWGPRLDCCEYRPIAKKP